jgi:hypothetical protein
MRACQTTFAAILLPVLMFTVFAAVSLAGTPTAINYQGRLTTLAGTPVDDGTYSIMFTIYDAASGGTIVWNEKESVTTSGGLFAVLLGTDTPIGDDVFKGTTRYLGIQMQGEPEMTPRVAIVTVPYAYRVSTVDGSSGGNVSGNINLDASTATTGNIFKGGALFIHNFGTDNAFVGTNAGNLTMTGTDNVGNGDFTLFSNTDGSYNTANGVNALRNNKSGTSNTASGDGSLSNNTTGYDNTATGSNALFSNIDGYDNTASGEYALYSNTSGTHNTALGWLADVSTGNLNNATAIGYAATVNASNKIRLGDAFVAVIEGQVAYTFTSDRNQKENFQPVDGDDVLRKIGGMSLTSWNYRNNDPQLFRHYGPVAQEFFAAFGHDGVGQCGDSISINSGDMAGIMMIAIQTLEKRTVEVGSLKEEVAELRGLVRALLTENATKVAGK